MIRPSEVNNGVSRIAFYAILALLTLWDARQLFQWRTPVGLDGYYYVLQVSSISKGEPFKYPTDFVTFFYICYLVSIFVGKLVVAIKCLALTLQALCIVFIYLIVAKQSTDSSIAVLSSLIYAASSYRLIFLSEYLKQLAGITFALLALCIWAQAIRSSSEGTRRWLAGACAAIALTSHISILPIVGTIHFLGRILEKATRKSRLILSSVLAGVTATFMKAVGLATGVLWMRWGLIEQICVDLFAVTVLIERSCPEKSDPPNKQLILGVCGFALIFCGNPMMSSSPEAAAGRLILLSPLLAAILVPSVSITAFFMKRKSLLKSLILLMIVGEIAFPIRIRGLEDQYLADRQEDVAELRRPTLSSLNSSNKPVLIVAPHGQEFMLAALWNVPTTSHYIEEHDAEVLYYQEMKGCNPAMNRNAQVLLWNAHRCVELTSVGGRQ